METVSFENSETANEESSLLTHHKLRLYGRDNEISILRQALESCRNTSQIIWIYGPSGVGKSKLVEHCFQDETHFCAGKFDFFPSPKPYSTITKALSHIIDFLSNAEYPSVKVSPDAASILIKLIPSASKVLVYEDIEGIPHSQRLKISESRIDEWGFQKLKQAIKTFIKGACEIFVSMSSSPLILYMNELQWADANSLEIIKYLLLDDISWTGLLFIGSYRDEELTPDSSVLLCKTDVEEKSNASVKSISLDNLMLKDVNQIISDLTNTDSSFSLPLAELIYAKTNGNPLDTISSLKFLCEKHIVRYSKSSGSWLWHEINSLLDIGLNANDVLALTFSSLPFETVEMLKISSCLGLEVDISLLHIILESFGLNLTSDKLKSLLKDAVSRQLIEMDGNGEFFYFLHDRIQYSAYQLVGLKETHEWTHLKIGRCILGCDEKFDQSLVYDKTLLAVDQLNRGRSLIVDQNEKIQLAQLNLDAADEFITASAFKMAQENLLIVIELTGADRWNQFYDLSMSSHLKLAKAYFGDGSMDQTLIQVDEICQNSKTDDDRKTAQILRLDVLSCSNRLSECMDFSLELLAELGHAKIPKNPGLSHVITSFFRVKRLLKKMSNDDILNLHECCDHRILCVLKIMGILGLVALYADKEILIPIVTCQVIELSFTYGLNEYSSFAFSAFGFVLTMNGDFDEAFRFGSLAMELMKRFSEDPKTLVMMYGVYYHIKKPLLDAIKPTMRAYYLAFSLGDLTYAGQASATHIYVRLVAGSPLNIIVDDIFSFCEQLKSYNQKMTWNVLLIIQRSCLELTNRSTEIEKLMDNNHDDDSFESYVKESNGGKSLYQFAVHTLQCRYYLGDIESALKYANFCWKSKDLQGAYVICVILYLCSALTALEQWKLTRPSSRRRYWLIFRKNHRNLISWTNKGNPNTSHLVHMLDAELLSTRKQAKPDEVKSLFDKSISKASRAGFLHDAALANERAGIFFQKQGDMFWTQHYLGRAKSLYADWGASAKVSQMEKKFGSLAEADLSEYNMSLPVAGRSRKDMVALVDTMRTRQSFVTRRSVP